MTGITETVRSTAQGTAKAESADKKSTEAVDAVSQERVDDSQSPEAAASEVQLSEEVANAIEVAEFDTRLGAVQIFQKEGHLQPGWLPRSCREQRINVCTEDGGRGWATATCCLHSLRDN